VDDLVHYEKRGNVALITLDNPPINALGAGVRKAFAENIGRAITDPRIKAVVVIGAGRCFSGGADIREFGQQPTPPTLRDIIDMAEQCPKPTVAAIHGAAYGGGLELPLGCHFRVGAPSAAMTLPEIKLGVIPGAGGTQRLPRLIGAERALEIILSGDPVGPDEAKKLGILDAIADSDLVNSALAFAEARVADKSPLRKTSEMKVPSPPNSFFADQRKKIARRARGLITPGYCIAAVENAVMLPFADGMKKERESFVACRDSPQSKAQRHVFFAEREAAKIPDVPKDTPVLTIRTAAVIGCGTMGGGIVMNFANAGIPVTVVENKADGLEKGLRVIARNYATTVAKGRLSEVDMKARMALIRGTMDFGDVADADIVIEAVFEDMDVKKKVFGRLDRICKLETILATNTSTLDVDDIAKATNRPEKVIGTHFFSPANVMRLMENVRGAKTSPETIGTVMKLSKTLGKVGVLVGICDGFVGNRMYHCYTRQANFLLEEGALPQQVDKVIYDFGFAMGPFAVGDVAGLDVGWRIRQRRAATRPKDERYSPIADRICEKGRFGQKTGAGWYRYEEGDRTPIPDPKIEALIRQASEELGFERREISDDEIRERCLYALVNEGAKILEEGLALRAGDIDVIWIYGYGFPAHKGGPMFHADQVGLGKVYDALCRLADVHGDMLKPAPLLESLAKRGKGFKDL
jgi:3-hydroxyacyl-CoA dehydrogenase